MTDTIIDAAQKILAAQFKAQFGEAGFQSVGLGSTFVFEVACLMRVSEPNLTLTFADVQMQAGGSDCGVFALAFATAICYGHSPGKFHFDQQRMRAHSIECLEKKHFTMFPIRKERRQGRSNLVRLVQFTAFAVCQK